MTIYREIDNIDQVAPGATASIRGSRLYEVSYAGATWRSRGHSLGFGDFQYDAIVWDEAKQCMTTVCYQYTGLGGTDFNFIEQDMTPENMEKCIKWAEPYLRNMFGMPMLEAIANEVRQGRRVRLLHKMRYHKVGETGLALWSGNVSTDGSHRTKVEWDDGSVGWVNTHILEAEDWRKYLPDDAEARAEGNYQAHKSDFFALFR